MIYTLYGTDVMKSRAKLNTLVQTLLARKPDAFLVRITTDQFSEDLLQEYVQSQGLFEQKSIIVLDTIFEEKSGKDTVIDNVEALAGSNNVFVLLEGKLDTKTLNTLKKYSEKVQECNLPASNKKKSEFNIFALSDALGERDKKALWVTYQKGKMQNISDEEMHGILFWGVKNMLLAQSSKSATEAGLSPFVYNKAKKYASNYSPSELKTLSGTLVETYHNARLGGPNLEIALEKAILELS